MTRQNKLIILAVYLLILAIALPLYRLNRNSAEKRMQAEISTSRNELTKFKSTAIEMERLRKLFPSEARSTSFIEDLYAAAQETKLTNHGVSTENSTSRATSRGSAKNEELDSYRLKVAVEGNYRSIAEYIRKVQNIERFKRFTDIKLVPTKQGISGNLSIELFSLKGQNAR